MIIDKEFQAILPPLAPEEYTHLKKRILEEGCLDALKVWNGILIDGHNRYAICTENNIPFNTIEMKFNNREEAKLWIVSTQLARRNVSAGKRVELALMFEESVKAKAKERQQGGQGGVLLSQKFDEAKIRTDEELAKMADVSRGTLRKGKKILEEGTEEQKERMRQGGKGNSISAIHDEIKNKEVETKVCIDCGEEKPVNEAVDDKNICKECSNGIERKASAEKKSPEPKEEQPKTKPKKSKKYPFDMDLYDLSTVPEYTISDVLIEIEGSRENLIYIVDSCLEEREELIHKKGNIAIFNNKLNQIINELKERLIDEN